MSSRFVEKTASLKFCFAEGFIHLAPAKGLWVSAASSGSLGELDVVLLVVNNFRETR